MKIMEYPEVASVSEGDVLLLDGPTGTHIIKAKNLFTSTWETTYPVGALYASFEPTSPAELYGGSWVQIVGRFLRAANDTSTGGSDNITLTTSQIPSHYHGVGIGTTAQEEKGWSLNENNYNTPNNIFGDRIMLRHPDNNAGINTLSAGGGQAHSNMPLYQDVYVWHRVA